MVKQESKNDSTTKETCGLIMPISAIDECSEQHWQDVKQILFEIIEEAGFTPNLVSDADDVGVIQKRIIQNLYTNPIVICDISGKNPNVMFELGLRLAFDKPTIIIKDNKTPFSFDTSPIEHLEYPRDLRFTEIIKFKKGLKLKIEGTYQKAKDDPNFTPFLKHFGKFTVAKLDTKEVSKEDYIIEEIHELKRLFLRSRRERPDMNRKYTPENEGRVQSIGVENCEPMLKFVASCLVNELHEKGIDSTYPQFEKEVWERLFDDSLSIPICFRKEEGYHSECYQLLMNAIKEEEKNTPKRKFKSSAPTS